MTQQTFLFGRFLIFLYPFRGNGNLFKNYFDAFCSCAGWLVCVCVISGVFQKWHLVVGKWPCPPEVMNGLRSGKACSGRTQPKFPSNTCLNFTQGEIEILFESVCVGSSLLFPGATEADLETLLLSVFLPWPWGAAVTIYVCGEWQACWSVRTCRAIELGHSMGVKLLEKEGRKTPLGKICLP